MAEVTIRDLRKAYGGMEVIHGVNLDIPDKAITCIIGPSGCGKTTLLNVMSSFIPGDVRGVVGPVPILGTNQSDTVAYRNYGCSTGRISRSRSGHTV